MEELLRRTAGLPEIDLAAGDTVVREGDTGDGMWILVSGCVEIRKHGIPITSIRRPGAAIGEISLLLNSPYTATVVALEPSVVRFAAEGSELLASDPAVMRLIAAGLAERLDFVTSYLADLKNQYGDSPGLAMVSEVLGQLAHRRGPPAQPGSAREPNPDY
ncbi:Crp/Fnr family transcriptional regulator [Variovorax sp. GT1P44]|uniref:Crp/Fnr family transcriptional regulator n=1 Tax=Variovorax sp. GT1P44 TaxID=3443742 RepID=UPI003F45360F